MNQALKGPWLEALRSGEYSQTAGTMYRPDGEISGKPRGYCCLGVLAEVACNLGLAVAKADDQGYRSYRPVDSNPDDGNSWSYIMPTYSMENLFGFDSRTSSDLAEMNDDGVESNELDEDGNLLRVPQSFEEIANWIEKNL